MANRPSITPVDQDARMDAVESPIEVLHVVAGAGCGKTTLLTDRYIHLLEADQRTPKEIVAITFTEKSAMELRHRIREKLKGTGLEHHLSEIEYAPIGTIHSFCLGILREHPFEAQMDPSISQFDEVALRAFLYRCFRQWFAQKAPSHSESFYRWFSHGIHFDQLRKLGLELYQHRAFQFPSTKNTARPHLEHFLRDLQKNAEELWEMAQSSCAVTEDDGYQTIEKLYKQTQSIESLSEIEKEKLILSELHFVSKGSQKNWLVKENCKKQKDFFSSMKEPHQELCNQIRRSTLFEVLEFLKDFPHFVEEQKRSEKKLDFDDLLYRTYRLLSSHPLICTSYQHRYAHFLIDEFQDTDPLQMKIFSLLMGGNERAFFNPNLSQHLFIVGDPNQSIYRFRQASVEMYAQTRQEVQRVGQELSIYQNFRSSKKILSWVNDTFSEMFGKDYLALESNPCHLYEEHKLSAHLLEAPENIGGSASDMRMLEAASIAKHIQTLVNDPTHRIFDSDSGELRPIDYGDIAILFPKSTGLDFYEQALRAQAIPFSVEGGSLFFKRMEIQGMIACLKAIADPHDGISTAAALRSILIGCSFEDLSRFSSRCPSFNFMDCEDMSNFSKPLRHAIRTFQHCFAHSHLWMAYEMIEYLCERLFVFSSSRQRFHGQQAAANLKKFLWFSYHFESKTRSLRDFLTWISQREMLDDKMAEARVSESGNHDVTLMTIHKSKGLEFPVVFLCNLSGEERTSGQMIIKDAQKSSIEIGLGGKEARFASDRFELLLEKEVLALEEEKKRLLYVGATRARDLLVLCKFFPDRKGRSVFSLLEPTLEKTAALTEVIHYDPIDLSKSIHQKHTSSQRYEDKTARTLYDSISIERGKRDLWIKGYTKHRPSEKSETGALDFLLPHSSLHGSMEGAQIGSFIHELLDVSVRRKEKQLSPWMRKKIENTYLSDREEILTMVKNFFSSTLHQRILASAQVLTELPFSFFENEILIEGSMDLVFREQDQWILVDYKSDFIQNQDMLKQKTDLYRPQLDLYKKALEKNSNTKVGQVLLFFLRTGDVVAL